MKPPRITLLRPPSAPGALKPILTSPRLGPPPAPIKRTAPLTVTRRASAGPVAVAPSGWPNPYEDFWKVYTPEGGVELNYRDIDPRWRWIVLRWSLWSAAMVITAWFAFHASPIHSTPINLFLLAAFGVLYWLVVRKPVELYRKIEIRPDAMILDRADVFRRDQLELAWPQFVPDAENNFVLTGVTGTRAVEYLTVRRFDENDRMPEVLAAHLQAAMQQLWQPPGGR
jgi:hypothetical protein